jgi:hypothetical protein
MNSSEVWRPGGDKAIYAIETFHSIDAFVTGAQTMSESTRVATERYLAACKSVI